MQPSDLLRYCGWTRRHQLSEPGIIAKTCELRILVYVLDPLVSLLERPPEVLERTIGITPLGAQLGDNVGKARAILRRRQLCLYPVVRSAVQDFWIELNGRGIGLGGFFKLLLA